MQKRLLSIMIATVTAVSTMFAFASCNKEGGRTGDAISADYEWAKEENYNGTDIPDSSEFADYTGKNIRSLVAWNTTQTGNFKTYNSSNDVVSPEIKRITGVSIDNKNSFDNKGSTAEVRYNQLLTMNRIPDIAYGSGWLDPEDVWDLTDLIDEYCPTIKARMPSFVWSNENVNGGQPGKVFAIPYGLGNVNITSVDPLADPEKCVMFQFLEESKPYVLVREDILKDAYPEALTTADIDRIYAEEGKFTEEQLFDINITSAKQFREEFLPKIQKAIDDGGSKYEITPGRRVRTMLVTAGSDHDTWDFLGKLVPGLLGSGYNSNNTNFSYWDASTQKIESMLYQDFYKNEVYEWAKMIEEGTIVSKTGMTTNHSTLASELNSGYYAIGYLSSSNPAGNMCTWKDGTKIPYRKVYLNIPFDFEKFIYCGTGEANVDSVKFFKSEVSESELPQLLRWLDFQCSRTADKLFAWGPETAGLFDEDENGVRTYKDEELVQQMVFSTAIMGEKVQRYNLSNGTVKSAAPVFPFYYQAGSMYHPKATYDLSSLKGLAASYYTSATVCKDMNEKFVGLKQYPTIHKWTNVHLDGVEAVWNKRDNIEDDLKQLLIAGASKNSFDKAWENMQTTLKQSGWTKSYFNGKFTNAFLTINKDYLDQFYKGE